MGANGGEIGLEEAQEDVTEDVGVAGEDCRGVHPHTLVQACEDRGGGGEGGGVTEKFCSECGAESAPAGQRLPAAGGDRAWAARTDSGPDVDVL
jgi:cytochrome c5